MIYELDIISEQICQKVKEFILSLLKIISSMQKNIVILIFESEIIILIVFIGDIVIMMIIWKYEKHILKLMKMVNLF